MSDQLNRLEGKVDHVVEKINSIDVTLAKQHVSIDEHIRRTAILEDEVRPLKDHLAMVHGAFKLIGMVAVVAGIAEGVAIFLEYIGKK